MRTANKVLVSAVRIAAAFVLAISPQAMAAPLDERQRSEMLKLVELQRDALSSDALAIWNLAEVGYQEHKSADLLEQRLRKAGFTVTAGVAGMPTAFVASFKSGAGPVIGILAEYDALPGISQGSSAQRQPILGKDAAHACGHNLFGAASVASAIALKEWVTKNAIKGEIRVYGSPAEEGGSGKVYLVREGLFKDVDAVLHWHPADKNGFMATPSMANISGKFRFHGVSAHAAASPERGISALDGLQVMDTAVEYLREHIPDRTRIHYVITDGGKAPNVVPDFAESYYYVRQVDPQIVRDVWKRVVDASRGAAIATGASVDYEITGGVYSMLVNKELLGVAERNFRSVPIRPWNPQEMEFARKIAETLPKPGKLDPTVVSPIDWEEPAGGSTDVSDVSWVVPTVGIFAATYVPGTAAHSWQSAAAAGTNIGVDGAFVASEVLALTGAELFQSPEVLAKAKSEMQHERGTGFAYSPMLGDRKPPLDYRAKPSS